MVRKRLKIMLETIKRLRLPPPAPCEYLEREIRLLAHQCPILQAVVSMHDAKQCTWEQAMTTAALELGRQQATLLKIATDAKMQEPISIVIDSEEQQ